MTDSDPGDPQGARIKLDTLNTREKEKKMLKIGKIGRERLERRHWVRFWGRKHLCKPCFIEKALGNGDKLLAVQPLNTRPQYYLIRVDSSWQDSNYQSPCVGDNMDDIYDAIEDEVGPSDWEDDRGRQRNDPWPAFSCDSGSCWWDATDMVG